MKKQVVIIGAGISGLVTAKALKEYGYDVIVLEKENKKCSTYNPHPGLSVPVASTAFIDIYIYICSTTILCKTAKRNKYSNKSQTDPAKCVSNDLHIKFIYG